MINTLNINVWLQPNTMSMKARRYFRFYSGQFSLTIAMHQSPGRVQLCEITAPNPTIWHPWSRKEDGWWERGACDGVRPSFINCANTATDFTEVWNSDLYSPVPINPKNTLHNTKYNTFCSPTDYCMYGAELCTLLQNSNLTLKKQWINRPSQTKPINPFFALTCHINIFLHLGWRGMEEEVYL